MRLCGLLWLLVVLPVSAQERGLAGHSVAAKKGVVVSVSPLASEVGRTILQRGGNAVDASVATAFALAVTWPEAGNLGGGGFMLVLPGPKEHPVFIDYRETAPALATRSMFDTPKPPSPHLLVGVPGTVRGLALAHRRLGKLNWKELVQPAVRLAEDGFVVDEHLASSLNGVLKTSKNFPELLRVYGRRGGALWQAGERLQQPELAATLRRIADEGPDAFYTGTTANLLVAEMQRKGGLITKADLAAYLPKVRTPVRGNYRQFDIYSAPPPSSGGTALIEMLHVLEELPLERRDRWSPINTHLIVETMKRAYLDRARHLGDPDFVRIPAHLTEKKYAKELSRTIARDRATPSKSLATDLKIVDEGEQTTHFSVVDAQGMAVANTYTLESSFGSRIVVPGAGFLLNNEMGDFNPRPGITDTRGRIGTPANQIEPGKRMLSSMTPTIVTRDGQVYLVTGSPGGRTIINTVLGIVLGVLEFDQPLRAAVDAPRMHHQWLPDVLRMEPTLAKEHPDLLDALRAQGHVIEVQKTTQGDAHSILIDARTGLRLGEADRRRGGWAAGH